MYDQSLALGYNRLTSETALLSQNPLVHEVNYNESVLDKQPVNEVMSKAQKDMLERIKVLNAAEISERNSSHQSKPASVQDTNEKPEEEV